MGQRLGSLIGSVGGLLFVLLDAGALRDPLESVVRLVGVAVFVGVAWYSVVRTRSWPAGPPPPPRAMRVYWGWVAAEVLAIPVGAQVLRVLHQPELTPVWVVLVVGVHFLPFAAAFRVPLFTVLGALLVVVAALGVLATWAFGAVGAGVAGIAAGVLLLAFAVAGAAHQDRRLAEAAR